jgi:hypothetical protein
MAVSTGDWLDLVRREYLSRFVPSGGAAVKFIVDGDEILATASRQLEILAKERRLQFVTVKAATTKLHMIQDVFFAIARETDFDSLAQRWVEAVFRRHEYVWPAPGQAIPIRELSVANRLDETLLHREVLRWLTAYIMRDRDMAQDFRTAMTHLSMRRMEMADDRAAAPVLEWLRGDLRAIGAVRQVPISSRITRHNGRAMLRSLCRWFRLSGGPGLALVLDIRQLGRTGSSSEDEVRYSAAAVLDAFEVLRQLIDDAESFEGLFVTVLADSTFVADNPKRSVAAYTALKERIWADVHARGHENPLAPLLQLSPTSTGNLVGTADMPFVKERVAIEALRAGVPNRAAIQLLGSHERALCDRFVERLRQCKAGSEMVEGEIIAGGFGSGKSHHLGILAEEALRENFIVSKVAISKETPLFDPDRLFASAVRNAVVPNVNDDAMTAVLARLNPNAINDLEKWATEQQWPQFAALMFLMPKQVIASEDIATISRFLGGSRLNASKIKQWLRTAGAAKLFEIKPVKAAQLAIQRIHFAPRLFRAAGYSGWCVLIDEAELIGRYSVLQRGKSYAELCRWLGLMPHVAVPGIVGLCAVTDDFKDAVLDGRLDTERIAGVLEAKGLDSIAHSAQAGMSAIERRQHFLSAPTEDKLRTSLDQVRELYQRSYGWTPAGIEVGERRAGKTIRQFIKSWITDWDIQRLYGTKEDMVTETITSDYSENVALEQAPQSEAEEEDVS